LLARTALNKGHTERAGRLWGAVEAEEKRAPPGWWLLTRPHERYNREPYISPLLASHDPQFERGRAEGQQLSLDQAISYAVESSATHAGAR